MDAKLKIFCDDRERIFRESINDILFKCAYVKLNYMEKSKLDVIPELINEIKTIQRMRYELEHREQEQPIINS